MNLCKRSAWACFAHSNELAAAASQRCGGCVCVATLPLSLFSLPAFVQAGGWLVFDNAQSLYLPCS